LSKRTTATKVKSTAPEPLDATGKRKWDELFDELTKQKIINNLDYTNLFFYCSTWSDLIQWTNDIVILRNELEQLKEKYKITDKEGREILSAGRSALENAYAKKSRLISTLHQLGQSMGFSAKSRKSLPTPADDDNPFLDLIEGKDGQG